MRSIVLGLMLVTGVLLAGCATPTMKFVAEGGPYAQRGAAAQVQAFEAEPPGGRPYLRVGRIEWDYTSNTTEVKLVDLLPQLKQKAWEVGGDAFIVREAGYTGAASATKPFHVKADVIRWQP